NRLRVVADDGEPLPARLQAQQNRRLESVRILVFINKDVVEPAADFFGKLGIAHHLRPAEQQVIVIENVLNLFGLNIGSKQLLEFGCPSGAPGKGRSQHLLDLYLGINAAGIDRKARSLGGKSVYCLGKSKIMAAGRNRG